MESSSSSCMIHLSIFSNKCCSRGHNRRQRKLVYIGDSLKRFIANMNIFVLDEQHRFLEDYSFSIKPTDVTLVTNLLKQFAHFSIQSGVQRNESAIVLLIDDDELLILLVALYKLTTNTIDDVSLYENLDAVCKQMTSNIQLSRNTLQRSG